VCPVDEKSAHLCRAEPLTKNHRDQRQRWRQSVVRSRCSRYLNVRSPGYTTLDSNFSMIQPRPPKKRFHERAAQDLDSTCFNRRYWAKGRRRPPMPKTHPPYAPEYRRRTIELARTGARLRNYPVSSRLQPMRSDNVSSRPDSMKSTQRRADDGRVRRDSTGWGARTGCCVKNARYYQKPRSGSRRRPAQWRHGVSYS